MELVIITGMSGAGKSNAVNALEDLGFYCVDNIPPRLMGRFLELCTTSPTAMERVAIVIDVRGGAMLGDLEPCLDEARENGYRYRLIFLDCEDEAILRRYKETRRRHPLMGESCPTIQEALVRERALLDPARHRADYYINTTLLKVGQLKQRVASLFAVEGEGMLVNCMSFGFKYGIPPEADLVLDLRSLPNPFYIRELKSLTGMDAAVYDYVFGFESSRELFRKMLELARMLIPLAQEEGRSQFTIAFGCTGGKHRSVSFARRMGEELGDRCRRLQVSHRDMEK